MAACRPASTNGPSSSGRGWPPPPRQQMQDFKDKVVLVTGGATGIGRAAALAFGRRGAQVVMAGRRQSEGDKAVAALAEIGSRGSFIAADVTKTEDLAALHRTILEEHGRLDVAFNNAGYQEPRAPLAEQDAALYDRVFDTNVRSVYLSLQHQVRIMPHQRRGARTRSHRHDAGIEDHGHGRRCRRPAVAAHGPARGSRGGRRLARLRCGLVRRRTRAVHRRRLHGAVRRGIRMSIYAQRARYVPVEKGFNIKRAPIEPQAFVAEMSRAFAADAPTGFTPLDLSAALGTDDPATTPFMLA